MKFLKCLLVVALFFFSCNKKEECIPPPCARPNLNLFATLTLQLCTDAGDEKCFSSNELSEVIFTQKRISSGDFISIKSITNLEENNFSIQIGAESSEFLFGDEVTGGDALTEVEYFYEIEVVATGDFFTIKDLKQVTEGEPCSCPSYGFESAKVNDTLTKVIGGEILLKK